MSGERDMNEHEKKFLLAAVMVHQLGVNHDIPDAAMDRACAEAAQVLLNAEAGDRVANDHMLTAAARLAAVVKGIQDARKNKVTH